MARILMENMNRPLTRLQSASADSPSATSFSWWATANHSVTDSRLPAGFPARFQPVSNCLSKDMTRSPAEAGSGKQMAAVFHPLKRVADGESGRSRLRRLQQSHFDLRAHGGCDVPLLDP